MTCQAPTRTTMLALTVAFAALAALAPAQSVEQPAADPILERVYYDYVDEDGRLNGGRVTLWITPPEAAETIPASVTSYYMLRDGDPANRIDLVTVGDGYTDAQLDVYAMHVDASLATMFSEEPFHTYANLFNVHVVDVISDESGVDHDPTYPIWRDTALDMQFWCNDIERLLCVDVGLAYSYANNAPDVDMVLAVANSTKYGGAGYSSADLATVAGGNSSAAEVALHEFGHSLGNLADEYEYGGPETYTGPEPSEYNVSTLTHSEMQAAGTKWAAWLGYNNPTYDGYVSTYEGAYYSVYGVYRPTNNSKMRALGRPFNLPSVEALVIEMYKIVNPIDDCTPTWEVLDGSEVVFVDPVDPVGHALSVQWSLDGEPIPGASLTTLDLAMLELSPGDYALSVVVTDNTWFVRDETARATWMTTQRNWSIEWPWAAGDMNCDGEVNFGDINPFVLAMTLPSIYESAYPDCCYNNADCNGDGIVDFGDINPFVALLSG